MARTPYWFFHELNRTTVTAWGEFFWGELSVVCYYYYEPEGTCMNIRQDSGRDFFGGRGQYGTDPHHMAFFGRS